MRIRLSELRKIVKRAIFEARSFDLMMASYEGQIVVTNGSQILFAGEGSVPQMPKKLSSLRFLGIRAEGDILNAFDPNGLRLLSVAVHKAA